LSGLCVCARVKSVYLSCKVALSLAFLLLSLNVSIGYGLTETSPNTHVLPEVDSISKVGSIGLLLPNLEARLLIDGDGNGDIEAGEGEAGELWLRGPSIMKVCFSFPLQS
jgi:long-subunit acyl-CoA synthetase (AMP-forming)